MKKGVIITIDGPSAAGKGTVARKLSKRLKIGYLDTGAMYRAIALLSKRKDVCSEDDSAMEELLRAVRITFFTGEDLTPRVLLNNEDVTEAIRVPDISALSSDVARCAAVRGWLREMQREIGSSGDIVAEGRDMGTYVFPEAEHKFFLDASAPERARRRWLELREKGQDIALQEVALQMEKRDKQDTERRLAPLHPAPDAVIIDTNTLTADGVVDYILKAIQGAHG
ncbi:MAG: (d)CMP kinase [Thermodesulfobacteriota bacterium]